jgi:hypothetical protein
MEPTPSKKGHEDAPTSRTLMAAGIILVLIGTNPPQPLDLVIVTGALILLAVGIPLGLLNLYRTIR